MADAEEQDVAEYLDKNKDFLETYVTERVPAEIIQKWLQKKTKRNYVSTYYLCTVALLIIPI